MSGTGVAPVAEVCGDVLAREFSHPLSALQRLLGSTLCANDSKTLTSPGIIVEGGERCLSHGEPEEGESPAAAGRGPQGGCA
jgi:hypothetical protein